MPIAADNVIKCPCYAIINSEMQSIAQAYVQNGNRNGRKRRIDSNRFKKYIKCVLGKQLRQKSSDDSCKRKE